MSVLLETSFGDITVDLFVEKAPKACLNFLKLCKLKHYNNALLAEVQKNYVVKVHPTHPSTIWHQLNPSEPPFFKDEINMEGRINDIGLLATANTASNKNDSSFFVTLTKAHLTSLSSKHTVFGKVAEGLQVLRKINDTFVDGENRPQMNIRILHTFVLADPFPELQDMKEAPSSPAILRDSDRLEAFEHLEMLEKCKTEQEMEDATRLQKAKKQALTLQILGDLPDAGVKPPEHILFICKLNPVTQERDLEVIFSRFGAVKSVQIVRDWKTGQSLQYGFVEFKNIQACEEAYLKMDNVLIDDRRIRVDFSQSVSKLVSRGRGLAIAKPVKATSKLEHLKQQVQRVSRDGKVYYGADNYEIVTKKEYPTRKEEKPRDNIEKQHINEKKVSESKVPEKKDFEEGEKEEKQGKKEKGKKRGKDRSKERKRSRRSVSRDRRRGSVSRDRRRGSVSRDRRRGSRERRRSSDSESSESSRSRHRRR